MDQEAAMQPAQPASNKNPLDVSKTQGACNPGPLAKDNTLDSKIIRSLSKGLCTLWDSLVGLAFRSVGFLFGLGFSRVRVLGFRVSVFRCLGCLRHGALRVKECRVEG